MRLRVVMLQGMAKPLLVVDNLSDDELSDGQVASISLQFRSALPDYDVVLAYSHVGLPQADSSMSTADVSDLVPDAEAVKLQAVCDVLARVQHEIVDEAAGGGAGSEYAQGLSTALRFVNARWREASKLINDWERSGDDGE